MQWPSPLWLQSGWILNVRGIGSCDPGPNQASKILAASPDASMSRSARLMASLKPGSSFFKANPTLRDLAKSGRKR